VPEELLDRILGEIRQRLAASRDAYEESRRLEAALAALGPAGALPHSVSAGPTPRARHAQRSRAPRGENLRRIREIVAERPGASAGEIASATGIGRPTVASTLAKLARDGELERTELPSGRVGYRPSRTEYAAANTHEPAPDTPADNDEVAESDLAAAGELPAAGESLAPGEQPAAEARATRRSRTRKPRAETSATKRPRAARRKAVPKPPTPSPTTTPESAEQPPGEATAADGDDT
jgi:hypothetical protein